MYIYLPKLSFAFPPSIDCRFSFLLAKLECRWTPPSPLLDKKDLRSVLSHTRLTSKTLADGLDDAVVLNVVGVVGLQLVSNTGKSSLERLFGGGVNHLGLFQDTVSKDIDGRGTNRRL